jgi:acyl dehydratase
MLVLESSSLPVNAGIPHIGIFDRFSSGKDKYPPSENPKLRCAITTLKHMIYFEDLQLDIPMPCGKYEFDKATLVDFASRYDPQAFHMDEEAARDSIFGRLTASGLQSASAARHLTLQAVLGKTRYLGSPGVSAMQMRSPVWPGRTVHVTHTFESIDPVAHLPGIAVVTGLTRGVDSDGATVIETRELNWIGSRELSVDVDAQTLRNDGAASLSLGPFKRLTGAKTAPHDDSKLYFEDCELGSVHGSAEFTISEANDAAFRGAFDAQHEDGSTLPNEWQGPALGIRVMADAFLLRTMNMGGPGLDLVRWPHLVGAGNRVRGELKIVQTRPLRSRPHVGLVKAECLCVDERDNAVASYEVTTFVRRRP